MEPKAAAKSQDPRDPQDASAERGEPCIDSAPRSSAPRIDESVETIDEDLAADIATMGPDAVVARAESELFAVLRRKAAERLRRKAQKADPADKPPPSSKR